MWVHQPETTICDFDTDNAAFRIDLEILLEGVGHVLCEGSRRMYFYRQGCLLIDHTQALLGEQCAVEKTNPSAKPYGIVRKDSSE